MLFRSATALLLASVVTAHKPKPCGPPPFTSFTTSTTSASTISSTQTSESTTTTDLPASCTFSPTQTIYATSGCALTCSTSGFCIVDAGATIPCGCPRLAIATQTVTVCPTATPCQQCTTAWGTFLVTQTCATATASAGAA